MTKTPGDVKTIELKQVPPDLLDDVLKDLQEDLLKGILKNLPEDDQKKYMDDFTKYMKELLQSMCERFPDFKKQLYAILPRFKFKLFAGKDLGNAMTVAGPDCRSSTLSLSTDFFQQTDSALLRDLQINTLQKAIVGAQDCTIAMRDFDGLPPVPKIYELIKKRNEVMDTLLHLSWHIEQHPHMFLHQDRVRPLKIFADDSSLIHFSRTSSDKEAANMMKSIYHIGFIVPMGNPLQKYILDLAYIPNIKNMMLAKVTCNPMELLRRYKETAVLRASLDKKVQLQIEAFFNETMKAVSGKELLMWTNLSPSLEKFLDKSKLFVIELATVLPPELGSKFLQCYQDTTRIDCIEKIESEQTFATKQLGYVAAAIFNLDITRLSPDKISALTTNGTAISEIRDIIEEPGKSEISSESQEIEKNNQENSDITEKEIKTEEANAKQPSQSQQDTTKEPSQYDILVDFCSAAGNSFALTFVTTIADALVDYAPVKPWLKEYLLKPIVSAYLLTCFVGLTFSEACLSKSISYLFDFAMKYLNLSDRKILEVPVSLPLNLSIMFFGSEKPVQTKLGSFLGGAAGEWTGDKIKRLIK